MRRRSLLLASSLAAPWLVRAATPQLHLVVQAANPHGAITVKQAVDLYMGRSRAFPNGDFALVFDLPRESAVRADFYLALTGLSPAQVNSYWARLMFGGQTMPPQVLANEQAMADAVRRTPNALGYLSQPPADRALRTVLVVASKTVS